MKSLRWLWLLASTLANHILIAQGLNFNDSSYATTSRKKINLVQRDSIPSKIDLSEYVPSVIDQGEYGTCVGVSTTYYARTILEAIRLGITDRRKIDELRYSPSFLYNNVKQPKDEDCSQGSEIGRALDYLKVHGTVKLSEQEYPYCQANKPLEVQTDSKLLDYVRLFGLLDESTNKVLATKKALAEMTPVVIGIQTTPSIDDLGFWKSLWQRILRWVGLGEEDFALWKPENSDQLRSGHAVCLVGYDDAKFGGAFRAVNSRGDDWGDEGFFWIRYTDYPTHTKYAYQPLVAPRNDTATTVLSGDVTIEFDTFSSGTEVPFVRQNPPTTDSTGMVAYRLRDPQKSGARFRFGAYLDQMAYLYILNASQVERTITKIYPITDTISTLIGANTKVMLPAEEAKKTYVLQPPVGKEFLLFIFSEKPVAIDHYVHLANKAEGSMEQRVKKAFGEIMVPATEINYKDKKMGFVLKGKHQGYLVPLMVSYVQVDDRPL